MQTTLTAEDAMLVLNGLPHMGPVTFDLLRTHLSLAPAEWLFCGRAELMKVPGVGPKIASVICDWQNYFDLELEKDAILKKAASFIPVNTDDYPPLLNNIYDSPIGMYAFGNYRPKEKCVAIVGSRRCTLYGQGVAKRLASDLAKAGFCVVSGMARGIDTAAHLGALEGGGKTVAVLGSGLNIIYPPENKDLYERIAESGAVMSEYCMNRRADRQTFPMRNRLVSGMSQSVIVVETDAHGGSMITAKIATEQGRHVFAVPGRIDQVSSRGCHQLIREGVSLLTSADDLLQEISYLGQLEFDLEGSSKRKMDTELDVSALNEEEVRIVKKVNELSKATQDELVESLDIPLNELAALLLMLELKKKVKKCIDGSFEVVTF